MKTFPNEKQAVGSKYCGQYCLANIYKHFGIDTSPEKLIAEIKLGDKSGTFIGQLGLSLLGHGLESIYLASCAYAVSPDWQGLKPGEVADKLDKWVKHNQKNHWKRNNKYLATYLHEGGKIEIVDLSTDLLDQYLRKGYLLMCCLETSWLWGKRKIKDKAEYDDIKGKIIGHYVVCFAEEGSEYWISDPYPTGLAGREGIYKVPKQRLLLATMLWGGQMLAIRKNT